MVLYARSRFSLSSLAGVVANDSLHCALVCWWWLLPTA